MRKVSSFVSVLNSYYRLNTGPRPLELIDGTYPTSTMWTTQIQGGEGGSRKAGGERKSPIKRCVVIYWSCGSRIVFGVEEVLRWTEGGRCRDVKWKHKRGKTDTSRLKILPGVSNGGP